MEIRPAVYALILLTVFVLYFLVFYGTNADSAMKSPGIGKATANTYQCAVYNTLGTPAEL